VWQFLYLCNSRGVQIFLLFNLSCCLLFYQFVLRLNPILLILKYTKMASAGIQARLEKYVGYLTLDQSQLEKIYESFQDELKRGLNMHKASPFEWRPEECSFKMLDSCVPKVANGSETGIFYAIDFGGSFLRSVRVSLLGNGIIETDYNIYSLKTSDDVDLPKGLMDANAPGEILFDRFSKQIELVMKKHGDNTSSETLGVGFTFSFPCIQRAITHSQLVEWTKEFETGRKTSSIVEGQNVGKMLDDAFQRNKLPCTVKAVLNDTVGTLLSCAYQKPKSASPCLIGLIVGTGSNACYVEPEWKEYGYQGQIVNIECGNFNRDLPLTEVDLEIDWNTTNRGNQLFEKLISGYYLGEMVRRTVIRVLQGSTPLAAWNEDSISTEDVAAIVDDNDPTLKETRAILSKRWEDDVSLEILGVVHKICLAVFGRSASLAASAVAAIATHTKKLDEGISCGVDGSLIVKNPWYYNKVVEGLKLLLGARSAKIGVHTADDGSGKGAGVIAAMC
ncbi:hexokinase, partial [Cardiosporidium cionae]